MQIVTGDEETLPPFVFLTVDVVEVMHYGKGQKIKVVARGKITNIEMDTLHKVIIYEDCVSLEVQNNHDDGYYFFKSVELDDPPINTIGEVVRNFIM